jgi:hypothetical protein
MLNQLLVRGVFYPILGVFFTIKPFFCRVHFLNRTSPQTVLINIRLRKEFRGLYIYSCLFYHKFTAIFENSTLSTI